MPTTRVIGLRAELARASFESLAELAHQDRDKHRELLAAIRALPLLIRRHGLAATLALYWNEGQAHDSNAAQKAARAVAERFAVLLVRHCPGGLRADGAARTTIDGLLKEPLNAYLLHGRIALVLADVWCELAEPLLPDARPAQEAAAAPAVEAAPAEESTHA